MDISCISCGEVVSWKRHALQCDGCARWQHRLCGTGMCVSMQYFNVLFLSFFYFIYLFIYLFIVVSIVVIKLYSHN